MSSSKACGSSREPDSGGGGDDGEKGLAAGLVFIIMCVHTCPHIAAPECARRCMVARMRLMLCARADHDSHLSLLIIAVAAASAVASARPPACWWWCGSCTWLAAASRSSDRRIHHLPQR